MKTCVLLVILSVNFVYGNQCRKEEEKPYTLLPKTIKPLNYTLRFQPHFMPTDTIPFLGSMVLRFEVLENTLNITLHAKELDINVTDIRVIDDSGQKVPIIAGEYQRSDDFYIIYLENELRRGEEYHLIIDEFEGIVNANNFGFYLASYSEGQEKKRLAVTKLETIGARRVFPSLDEPEWKATFAVTLVRPSGFSTISNEPLVQSNHIGNGLVEDVYKETVVMSTYLLAFVISEFDYIQRENHRVFSRPEAIRGGLADYALTTGIHMLKAFEEYLNIPYTLEKMDQVAIPNQYFQAGAMENWGLVMYKERRLLYSKETVTTSQLQYVAATIAHEFSHQWFGNLVTLAWWRYTWLNEGFARYFGYFGASLLYPEWRLMEQFIGVVHVTLIDDSFLSTRALNYDYPSIEKLKLIAYNKGSSVVRMIAHALTEEIFRKGLGIYLRNRQFNTSVPEDLFDSLQTAVDANNKSHLLDGHTVSTIFTPWVDQPGYPLVTVTRDYQTGGIKVTQKRLSITKNGKNATDHLWPVPLNFMFSTKDNFNSSETTAQSWITNKEKVLTGRFPTDGFLIVNKQQTGYYRVHYDFENWYRIIDFLKQGPLEKIHVLNRAQIINEVFALARTGVVGYEFTFNVTDYMRRETDYVVVRTFIRRVTRIESLISSITDHKQFKEYLISMLSSAENYLGFYEKHNDTHVDKLHRVEVMNALCKWGSETCRKTALQLLRLWKSNRVANISPDMQTYAICGALVIGDLNDWYFVWRKYHEETNEDVRNRLRAGLGCTEDKRILYSYLDEIFYANSTVPQQEKQKALRSVYKSGNFGLNTILDYLRTKFAILRKSSLDINKVIIDLSYELKTSRQLNQLMDNLGPARMDDALSRVIHNVKERIAVTEEYGPKILKAFERSRLSSK